MAESIGSMISRAHSLAADGERFLPGIMAGDIELEHVHRYKFAAQLSANKTVLDIASGEGYGSAYLSQTARRVIGVDISQDAVESAREKYERPNLEFLVGSCSEIPLDDATVDVVVSFETIEHHAEHEAMMREIKRVLRPRGLIVISSPDKLEYSDKPSFRNPFHVKELYREEFQALLDAHFKCVRMFGQRVLAGSALLCEGGAQGLVFHEAGIDSSPQRHLPAPKYLVAIASDRKLPVIKGGLLERDPAMPESDAETAPKRVAAILRTISINDSQCLKGRLNDLWYLQRNQDIAAKGIDPVAHWIEYGAKEGRLPAHNVEELARELIAEHAEKLHEALEEKEREFQQSKEKSSERQHMLEVQIEQARSQARAEADSHLRVLTDRERAFSEQLRQTQLAASEEREAQDKVANQQREALTKEYQEREQRLQLTIEAKERELRDSKNEAQERQRAAEVQIEQTRSQARAEIEGHLRMLAERERAFGEQFSQQKLAREEREAHQKATIHQLQRMNAQHEEREQHLRAAIEEKECEFRTLQRESIEQRKALEAVIGQNRVAASYAVETQLRALAERERAFGEQLSQQQRAAGEEKEAQRADDDEKLKALSTLHDELGQRLQLTIEETGRELRSAREVADAHLRMLADREQAFGEQLSLQQRAAGEEKEAQRVAADEKLKALSTLHDEREQRLRVTIEDRERELLNAKEVADAHLRMLADREQAFGEQLSQQQRAAGDEKEAQRAAADQKLKALSTLHDEREQRLRVTIEDRERELRNAREVADAHLLMQADREHAFGVEHSRQLQAAFKEREAQQAIANQRLQELHAQHDERERHLRATIEEKERALRDGKEEAHARQRELEMQTEQTRSHARNEVEAQLRALVERERVFAAEFAHIKALVDEERKLLRSQYLFSVNIIRNALNEMPQRRFWRRVARTLTSSTTVSDRSEAQVERQVRQTHVVNAKVKTIEDLLSLDGHDFIMCTYLTLLGRRPDATGYAFYIEQLESLGDKAAIIYQISSSREAKQNPIDMKGLNGLIRHQKWRRLPILRSVMGKFDRDPKVSQLRRDLEDIDRRVAAIDQGISSRLSHFEGNKLPPLATQIDAIFNSFDDRKYVKAHPDVAASGMNPYEHFVRFGWREKRQLSAVPAGSLRDDAVSWSPESERHTTNRPNAGGGGASEILLAPTVVAHVEGAAKGDGIKWSCIMQPASEIFQGDGYSLTRLMQFLWTSRQDLQSAFDIHQPSGRLNFFKWLAMNGMDEHGLTAKVFPRNLLEGLVNLGGDVGAIAGQALQKQHALENGALKDEDLQISSQDTSGANLVGYAFGQFGRGEDVRMIARSLSSLQVPFVIIDQDAGLHGTGDASVANWVVNGPRFDINIFLINADLFPFLPFKLGHDFCLGRYNIGYWAWELSMWPAEFELALDMVDEVWAISEFVAESVKTRARVPVITMPNAVTVPQLGEGYTKLRYGLPEDSFVFYFTFDAASHLDRKNPVAVVRAFNGAFPDGETKVHLLLKTMNVELGVPLWEELQKEVVGNDRITILTDRMSREEVLGLNLACDAFVSLHRSEGFGRCVAEAMAYGKPVIATNYSGTRDFAKEGTACVVDYRLVPVPEGAYPFCDNQVWADPDIGHAAALMQRLVNDEPYRRAIALAGQKFVIENFSQQSIGTLYAKRLSEIRASRIATSPRNESEQDSDKVLLGNIDSPTAEECLEACDTVPIEGWMASPEGIDTVRIYVDSAFVANAHYGVLRPDIHSAFPRLPNSGRSGFCYLLNIADFADGDHTFSVVASCRSGISRTWTQPFYKRKSFKYEEWLQKSDELYMTKSVSGIRRSHGLLLSLVLRLGPMIDTVSLRQTLGSLAVQRNSNFELICLLGDDAQEKIVADTAFSVNLTAKLQFLLGKTSTWSSVVDQCCGELIGLVDLGDIFRPWAFGELDESIHENGPIDLIYADEDIISGSDRGDPSFKPGWSPIFLDSYNYIGRPWFASRTAFSSAVSGSLDGVDVDEHELLKIIGRKDSLVGHIPTVLLSRTSPLAHVHGQSVVRDNISERNVDEDWPKVSIIIPTRLGDEELISQCFDGLERNTDYPNFEVIVVVNNLRDPEAEERHLGKRTFRVVHWDGAFNWAGINNLGATHAKGELFLFLNDDIEPLENDWLKILVQTLVRTRAGAAGCLLRYPNGTIQHSGVHFVNYGGGARHLFRFCAGDEARLSWLMKYPREVSAVTGACLLTTRDCFNAVNGFDDELPLVGNDTDYCLRVWRNGSSVVVQPEAKLIHHEGVSRQGMSEVKDVERFWKKWAKFLELGDFFSNPNLDAARDDWTVNPSIEKTFKLRRRFSTDQRHSRGMNELEDGLYNMGTIDDSLEEWQGDSDMRANA